MKRTIGGWTGSVMLCLLAPQAWAEGVTHAGPSNVPELLVTAAGEKVTTRAQWEQVRRPEILKTLCTEE